MIELLSSCLVLPWEKRNLFVRGPCSFSSQSNFVTFRSLSFSSNLSDSVFSKGCLSMSTLQRPNRHSVVCMAKKYASNTDKRKKLSRKKGGNSNRKKKSRRKGRKRGGNSDRKKKRRMKWGKKKVFKIVRLVSTAATGFVYTMKKSSKITDKLQQLKYDPRVKRHILFEEVN